MRIQIKEETVTINATDGDTIIFSSSNLDEFSNALMIIRHLKERNPLETLEIKYGQAKKVYDLTPKGGD